MIIKSISAENFGKFDRYSVNLDDNINVFFGDNEAGKTTLYEIISILLFAPTTEEEIKESNKLIKSDEKYARVYATINMDGKEISIAREIYVNDTNLSIADQDNVSSLGNVNVPFIGDLSKEMYESLHTVDYYNMATISKNVWQQIIQVIEDSHGAPRKTPDYSSPESDITEKRRATFEKEISEKEKQKVDYESLLIDAQKKQKRMIKNQDKIDDIINDLEDIENHIELESSYLKEAEKMNQIRSTIKKTQDLTLELEKYNKLKPWMPNLRERYERLKLYNENKASGIENPLDMFDDFEAEEAAQNQDSKADEQKPNLETNKEEVKTVEKEPKEIKDDETKDEQEIETPDDIEDTEKVTYHEIVEFADEDMQMDTEQIKETVVEENEEEDIKQELEEEKIEIPEQDEELKQESEDTTLSADEEDTDEEGLSLEEKYRLAAEKINSIIENKYIKKEDTEEIESEDKADEDEKLNSAAAEFVSKNLPKVDDAQVKPLEIRKPSDKQEDEMKETGVMNIFGQTNPYSDNIFPDMDDVNYSGDRIAKIKKRLKNTEDNDKHLPSTSNTLPTQTQQVPEEEMNGEESPANPEDKLLEAEDFLNNINMQEIIELSKEKVEVDDEVKEEIDKAQLRYKVIARRVFEQEMDIDDLSQKLKKVNTNVIYKSIVKYKGLSQKQRKMEQSLSKEEIKPKKKSSSVLFGVIAVLSLLLGAACFFIDQIMLLFPDVEILTDIYNIIMGLPLDNIVAGNILAGSSFALIAILLLIAIILDSDKAEDIEQDSFDEIELDDLKNDIRMAKREVVDALIDFPIPPAYLEDPNNAIINVITELRDAESVYHEAIFESKMPKNEVYRTLWRVVKAHLDADELSDDLFDNISKLRRKIQDHKENKAEKEKLLQAVKMQSKFSTDTSGMQLGQTMPETQPVKQNDLHTENNKFMFNQTKASETESKIPAAQNASESTSFGLPTTTSQNSDKPFEQIIPQEQDTTEPFPTMKEPAKNEYPDETDGLQGSKDFSYPQSGGMFGASKNTSYPDKGGALSEHLGSDYSEGETFGAAKETSFGLDTMTTEEKQTVPSTEQSESGFDIPGVNRYPSGAQEEKEINSDNNVFGSENQLPKMGETDDPFSIPGIKRYTGQEQKTESTNKDPFAKAAVDSSVNEISSQSLEDDDPFGIPGIKRYKYEPTVTEEETSIKSDDLKTVIKDVQEKKTEDIIATEANNQFSVSSMEDKFKKIKQERDSGGVQGGLPGMDKFSNRNDSVSTEKEGGSDEVGVPVVPTVPTPDETAAASIIGAGALASSKLPGLDRFSNRGETINKEKPTEEEPADNRNEQTIEADPFGIPNIAAEQIKDEESTLEVQESQEDQVIQEEQEQPKEESAEVMEEPEEQSQEDEQAETIEDPADNIAVVTEKIKVVKRDRREKEFDELLELLGDDPESTIRDIEDVTRALHREISKRDAAMDELLKLNDAAIRLSTLSSNKWPYKQKAIDASRERIDYLEADKLKKQRHLAMMEEKIEADEFEDTPQAISDKIKALEEEIEQLKLESDKHALAEELIEKQRILDMSSSEDRSHIVDDTSTYMKELTLGKYVQVKINDDLSGLSICDNEGQWYDTTKDRLSQATREQLYLALRISIADLFDEKSIIFPMFFDEALITWDKSRMKAVMRLLSKMSTHRQVIIFTCHDWLKDMISDYMIGAKIIMM